MKKEISNLQDNKALNLAVVMRCSCGWEGHDSECEQKSFGAYCGDNNDWDNWGWEEWSNLACPKCGKEVECVGL